MDGLPRKEGKSGHTSSLRQGPAEASQHWVGCSVCSLQVPPHRVATSHHAHSFPSPPPATLAWRPPCSEAWRLAPSRLLLPDPRRPEGSPESPLGMWPQMPAASAQHPAAPGHCVCPCVHAAAPSTVHWVFRTDSLSFQQTLGRSFAFLLIFYVDLI